LGDSITVNVKPLPTVSVNSVSVCRGHEATLIATPSVQGGSYSWSPISYNTNLMIDDPSSTSTYTVTYTLNGCYNTASGTINITPSHNVNITSISNGETATLTANSSTPGGNYVWFPTGDTTQSIIQMITTINTYMVTYTVNDCEAVAEITIKPESTLYIPNSFTPNNDGTNDFFSAKGTFVFNYTMEIFNRWGELILQFNLYTNSIKCSANTSL